MGDVSPVSARYSCRAFTPQAVARETIVAILEQSQRAASWCNIQPWQVALVSGAAARRLSDALLRQASAGRPGAPDIPFPTRYEGAFRERRKACAVQLYQSVGIGREDREASARQALENFRLFGAPHTLLIATDPVIGYYGGVDCGSYIATFMTVARAHGVDTIAQAALASYPDVVRAELGWPAADLHLLCGISFGYAVPEAPVNAYRTSRAELDQVVRWYED